MCCCGCELVLALTEIQESGSADAQSSNIRPTLAAPVSGSRPGFVAKWRRLVERKNRWIFSPVLKSFASTSPALGSTNG